MQISRATLPAPGHLQKASASVRFRNKGVRCASKYALQHERARKVNHRRCEFVVSGGGYMCNSCHEARPGDDLTVGGRFGFYASV